MSILLLRQPSVGMRSNIGLHSKGWDYLSEDWNLPAGDQGLCQGPGLDFIKGMSPDRILKFLSYASAGRLRRGGEKQG